MIFLHGGGFVAGTLDTEDAQCRYFASKAPCLVMRVDYPKLVKPGLGFDVLINQYGIPSIKWCRQKASSLGADVSQTVLCGGSAGAMFSAQMIHHYCVEKGDRESITGAVLWYPCVLPYTYGEDGKYKEMYKSWSQYLTGKVPIIKEEVIKSIWRESLEIGPSTSRLTQRSTLSIRFQQSEALRWQSRGLLELAVHLSRIRGERRV